MTYKILSFDLFQTLVDVNERIPEIWQGILGETYTDEKAKAGASAVLHAFPDAYASALRSPRFLTMEQVYLACATQAARELPFDAPPRLIARQVMREHANAPFYPEVPDCLARLGKRYRIILSSDSGRLMTDGLLDRITHERAFLSDDLRFYKGDPGGGFFRAVLRALAVDPSEILHIGDSAADVFGAHAAGISACWLSRENRPWRGEDAPELTVHDLGELERLLP